MLLTIPYFGVECWCTVMICNDGPTWLNLVVLIYMCSGLKILWISPVSLSIYSEPRQAIAVPTTTPAGTTTSPSKPEPCDGPVRVKKTVWHREDRNFTVRTVYRDPPDAPAH